ncbi:VanZ family protein [Pontibacter sp. H259]|uniref:VanZ family protein n=1 Tax=Pontibacter sp. H259 TaxID=3133421 RepID=UPI0030BA913E
MILRYNLFTILWAAVILLTTLLPASSMPSVSVWDLLSFDSFAHAGMFAILCFLMIVGMSKQFSYPKLKHHAVLSSFIISLVFGLVIELIQFTLIPGRSAEFMDVVSNTIGCVIGIVIFKWIYIL